MSDTMNEILGTLAAANACFAAGVKAADENNPAARKLRRLIAAVENTMEVGYSHGEMLRRLRAAIKEARKP